MRGVLVELRRIGAAQTADVPGEFHHRELHAETDAEEGVLVLARVARRADLALRAAVAESTRDQDRVEPRKRNLGPYTLDVLGVDVLEVDSAIVGEPAVHERLVERFVRI